MSHTDIAAASGLERSTVAKLSKKTSWDSIPIETAEKFSLACGVNLLSYSRQVDFLKRRKKAFIKSSKNPEFYRALLNLMKKSKDITK